MRAALWLRLAQSRRRGGPALLAGGVFVIALVSLFGSETVDGRYGLATDLAAVLAYLAAVFLGAFPIATDRERKRSFLPGASPVTPWRWAAGNALGAAAGAGLIGFGFFAAAGVGTALGGGIETHAVTRIGGSGVVYLAPSGKPLAITGIPEDGDRLRVEVKSYLQAEDAVGTPDAATIEVDGKRYDVYPDQTILVPVTPPRVEIANVTPEFAVGIVPESARVLGRSRSFLLNSLRASVAPAVGAAGIAVIGAAAGANLGGAVAALLTTLLLLLASMKGFLLETFEHEGKTRAAVDEAGAAGDDRGHAHGPQTDFGGARDVAAGIVKGTLVVLPDLGGLDRTSRVALGEWIDRWSVGRALLFFALALLVATGVGGVGVNWRKTP